LELFWVNWSKGIKLILSDGENREEIGGVRKTKNGFDAWNIGKVFESSNNSKNVDILGIPN